MLGLNLIAKLAWLSHCVTIMTLEFKNIVACDHLLDIASHFLYLHWKVDGGIHMFIMCFFVVYHKLFHILFKTINEAIPCIQEFFKHIVHTVLFHLKLFLHKPCKIYHWIVLWSIFGLYFFAEFTVPLFDGYIYFSGGKLGYSTIFSCYCTNGSKLRPHSISALIIPCSSTWGEILTCFFRGQLFWILV